MTMNGNDRNANDDNRLDSCNAIDTVQYNDNDDDRLDLCCSFRPKSNLTFHKLQQHCLALILMMKMTMVMMLTAMVKFTR